MRLSQERIRLPGTKKTGKHNFKEVRESNSLTRIVIYLLAKGWMDLVCSGVLIVYDTYVRRGRLVRQPNCRLWLRRNWSREYWGIGNTVTRWVGISKLKPVFSFRESAFLNVTRAVRRCSNNGRCELYAE